MKLRWMFLSMVTLGAGMPVFAGDTYTLHEALRPGQKVACELTFDTHTKTTSTTAGKTPDVSDTHTKQFFKVAMTILEEKDGSATKMNVLVDPASVNIALDGNTQTKTAFEFAGKTMEIRRLRDGTVANDFKGDADPSDIDTINDFLNPDQDFYPDHPVAVGDTWDISDKLSKHSDLGPTDKMLAQCRLDSVKNVDGKQLAQLTCSCAEIRHEDGNVEEDVESTILLTVDIAAGQIIKSDLTSKSNYSTPASETIQVTGGTECTAHTQCAPVTPAATQP